MWSKEHQLGFGEYERSFVKKPTRREMFLAKMEAVMPFSKLLSLIKPLELCSIVSKQSQTCLTYLYIPIGTPRKTAVLIFSS